MIKNSNILLIN
jgi:hypothetical protein